ncbi:MULTISPECIES: hypothetical protein [Microbacterium]|uniref:Uncharacterized protein n=1 Tax=Microbacterium aquilitoris TaxID=3067307 RepID=A0ABU3GK04_9MICO|nr:MULTISPECIES: hypothetical protein [unclassified Microbacterium]MDT3329879.1 hypothetical protein [Microbacterium sp. KSW-18]MDT3345713.1 hypothetical protein [Microbacterium sp. KSW2-22]
MVKSMEVLDSYGSVDVSEKIAAWHEVEAGFWVGNTDGRFLGTVEQSPAGWITRDHAGGFVGKYPDAAEARAAIG